MTEEMKNKLDSVLERVRDPESGYPISRLGLVERFRYSEEKGELYVFTDFLSHQPNCMACVGIAATIISTIRRNLLKELNKEFPDLNVSLV